MKIVRLTRVAACVRFWDHFVAGFHHVELFLKYQLALETYRQILFALAVNPKGWVGICLDETEEPRGFMLAHECTPIFAPHKEYEVSVAYAKDNSREVLKTLQASFEQFAKEQGVTIYYATTRRDSGVILS